jgi:hypothetical protein
VEYGRLNREAICLLMKHASKKEKWEAEYRDSLDQEMQSCRKNAKQMLLIIQMALDITTEMALPPRCNMARQDGPTCGQFGCHYANMLCRRFLGEGHSAGHPDPKAWTSRISQLVNSVIKDKGISELDAESLQMVEKKQKEQDDAVKALAAAIRDDFSFQEQMQRVAKLASHESFGSLGGCPKCNRARFGSTCCNPQKIKAKIQAEEEFAKVHNLPEPVDGRYDKARYTEIYNAIMHQIAQDRGMPDKWKQMGGKINQDDVYRVLLSKSVCSTGV